MTVALEPIARANGIDGKDAQTAWVHHVLIDVEAQGRGVGRAAMLSVGGWLREQHPTVRLVGLNVLPDNARAMRMYASLGFVPVAETVDGQTIMLARVSDLAGSSGSQEPFGTRGKALG